MSVASLAIQTKRSLKGEKERNLVFLFNEEKQPRTITTSIRSSPTDSWKRVMNAKKQEKN